MTGTTGAIPKLNGSRLGGITYRLARTSADFRAAHELMKQEGVEQDSLRSPTVLAFSPDGELIGLLGTQSRRDVIQAGPLVLASGRRRPFTALRLVEAYDMVMRSVGVSTYTTFVWNGEQDVMQIAQRMPGFEQIGQNSNGVLFARRL